MDEGSRLHSIASNILLVTWSILMIMDAVTVWVISVRLYKELRSQLIDLFKVTQYIWLILFSLSEILYLADSIVLHFAEHDFYAIELLYLFEPLHLYFIVDLQCWVNLIVHFSKLFKTQQGIKIRVIQKEIKRYEVASFVFFIVILTLKGTIWIITWCFYFIDNDKYSHRYRVMRNVSLWLAIILISSCAIASVLIYLKLRVVLKNKLYYYYVRINKNLVLLLATNMVFFISLISARVLFIVLGTRMNFNYLKNWTFGAFLLYLLIVLTFYLPYFYMIYFNTNNIKFKEYLSNIYFGMSEMDKYRKSSLFIKTSWWAKRINRKYSSDTDTSINIPTERDSISGPVLSSIDRSSLRQNSRNYLTQEFYV